MGIFGRGRTTVSREDTLAPLAHTLMQQDVDTMAQRSEELREALDILEASEDASLRRDPNRPLPPYHSQASGKGVRTGTPVTRLTLPTGDGATDLAVKSSYFTVDTANRARKISLYQAWLGETWVSSCVEAIAARLISGGWVLKPDDALNPNAKSKEPLEEFLNWCNPDEDFNEIVHSCVTDLLWCGECYLEVTSKRANWLKRTVPYELWTIDPISMDYILGPDKKSIVGYQQVTDQMQPLKLDTNQIIRVWLPDPRNRYKALSPLEKMLNPVTLDTYLQLSEQKYFQQGNRGDVAIILQGANAVAAARFTKWITERFLGVKNAHKPLIIYGEEGELQVQSIGNRAELDVIGRRKLCRDEILAGYKVPPHLVSALEGTGQGGQAVGDTMESQFIHTAVDPVKKRLMGPLTFRLATIGFGIDDWRIDTVYSDMRDTTEITDISQKRVFAGFSTINKELADNDQEPIEGGDVPFLVVGTQLIPIAHLPEMAKATPPAVADQAQQEQQMDMQQQDQEHQHGMDKAQFKHQQDATKQQFQLSKEALKAKTPPKPGAKPGARGAVSSQDAQKGARSSGKGPKPGKTVKEAMDLADAILESAAPEQPAYLHKYGNVQAPLPDNLDALVRNIGQVIPDYDLAEDGREDNPHITVYYGLTQPEQAHGVISTLTRFHPPFPVQFGPLSVFRTPDYDVLYVSIISPTLHGMHAVIGKLTPVVNTHPVYTPHATVAYLKPGRADFYRQLWGTAGMQGQITKFELCDRNENTTVYHLGDDPSVGPQ